MTTTAERASTDYVEIDNPKVTDDDYFHGPNPTKVGFGSRGPAAESILEDATLAVEPGQSTAEVQNNAGGLGWNEQAGGEAASGPESGSPVASNAPDHSWSNDRIREYAAENNLNLHGASTKAEMLDAIAKGDTGADD